MALRGLDYGSSSETSSAARRPHTYTPQLYSKDLILIRSFNAPVIVGGTQQYYFWATHDGTFHFTGPAFSARQGLGDSLHFALSLFGHTCCLL